MNLSPFAFLFLSALRHVSLIADRKASVGFYFTMQEGWATPSLLYQTVAPKQLHRSTNNLCILIVKKQPMLQYELHILWKSFRVTSLRLSVQEQQDHVSIRGI